MTKKEEEIQKKYIQLQIMKQQMNTYVEEKKGLDEKVTELVTTASAIGELNKIKKGEEIWSPFGSGAFVRSDIKDIQKVMISIGAGIVVAENKDKALEIIQSRLQELEQLDKQFVTEINSLGKQIEELEEELQKLVSEQ